MENINKESMIQLFDWIETILNTKTIVGEPIVTETATIIPLIEKSCGMGLGSFDNNNKNVKQAGGMTTKLTPVAVLVIQNGYTKVINIKNQDAITKLVDILPDLFSKITDKVKIDNKTKQAIDNIDVQFINE